MIAPLFTSIAISHAQLKTPTAHLLFYVHTQPIQVLASTQLPKSIHINQIKAESPTTNSRESRADQELNPDPLPTALPHCQIQVFLLLTAHAGGVLTIPRPCPKRLPCGNPSRNNTLSEGGLLSPLDRQHCLGEESNGLTWTKSPGQQWQSWNSSPAKPKVLCCLCSKEKDCCHPPFNLPSAQKVTQEDCRCCQTLAPAHHH